MYFVLLAAAIAILAGVVAVAMGWGGELAASSRDLPPVSLWATSAADVAMLRLPAGVLGYQREATDQALYAISLLVSDRDAEIARLRDEVWRLSVPERGERTEAGPAPAPLLAAGPAVAAGPAAAAGPVAAATGAVDWAGAVESAGAVAAPVPAEPPVTVEPAPPS